MKKETYTSLKQQFGSYASWALWQPPTSDSKRANIGDMSVFDRPDILDVIHTDFVLIGINASVHPDRQDGYTGDWQMFHSEYANGYDYRLRTLTKDTPLEGCYMTDMVKDYPEAKSKMVKDRIKNEPKWFENNLDRLREELALMDNTPTLITFGGLVYENLNKHGFDKTHRLIKLTHYSYRWDGHQLDDIYYNNVRQQLSDAGII